MIEQTFNRSEGSDRAIARDQVRLLGTQSSTLLLLLSLNLLLIVFFVVLNTNASIDLQRSSIILGSVQKSFGEERAVQSDVDAVSRAKVLAQDALRTSVSTAFASVLEGQDVIVRNEADRFWVEAPMTAFFEPETGKLRAVLPVLNRIASILKTPADGFRYDMTVTIDAAERDDAQAILQAGALAEDLLRRDFAPTLFAVGVAPADGRKVTFTFQVFTDDMPVSGAVMNGGQP